MNLTVQPCNPANQTGKFFLSDQQFDKLLPPEYRTHSPKHFTPLEVCKRAAGFLAAAATNSHTLDIGAGIGKFCAIAGYYTRAKFTGIEQRPGMVETGNRLLQKLGLDNVQLKVENMAQTDFRKFTGIYFFNSFYENIEEGSEPIDTSIQFSASLFRYYSDLLYEKLNKMPVYTRLATYHTTAPCIPDNYTVLESCFGGNLKLWIKYKD